MFQGDHAETIKEADQWVEEVVSGKLFAALLTPDTDVVMKAIKAEVEAGRGSPHGGAFLDISHRAKKPSKRNFHDVPPIHGISRC